MQIKQVSAVLNPPAPHMVGDGFRVHNFFPSGYKLKMSPFFLLDYNAKIEFSARNEPRGVGVHPHRGFETVTIAYNGAVAHHDSAGNSGVIYPGDIQWMTAASGILHKEYHEKEFSKKGGIFQMVQLWVNLPATFKMSKPKYQDLKQSQLQKFPLPDGGGTVEVIAGKYNDVSGSATTFSQIEMYNARLNKDAENSVVLILSGQPIDEPIAQYGPFLMNTPEEIQQAIADYNHGKFGYLEE
ncbi:MAG: pirin family protein [Pedobacter sp.]|nr:MAG: pirin family protein [Pedobacter sp.]